MNAQPLNRKRQVQTLWHTVVRTMCLRSNAGGSIAPFSIDAAAQCANRPTFSWAVSGQPFVRKTAARQGTLTVVANVGAAQLRRIRHLVQTSRFAQCVALSFNVCDLMRCDGEGGMELVGRQFGACNQHLRGGQWFGMDPIEVVIDRPLSHRNLPHAGPGDGSVPSRVSSGGTAVWQAGYVQRCRSLGADPSTSAPLRIAVHAER